MALNYQRVGWEDAPSTNTPLDAANLNHMDNGIIALSNEFDRVIPGLEDVAGAVSPLLPVLTDVTDDITDIKAALTNIFGDFAEVLSSSTAERNFYRGEHFVLNGLFYVVTSNITSGETIVPDTNVKQTSVGAELSNRKMWFKNVPISVSNTVGTLVNISHPSIDPTYVLGDAMWGSGAAVSDLDWSSEVTGTFVITGKCSAATTLTFSIEKADYIQDFSSI